MTVPMIIITALLGALGALVKVLLEENGKVALPRIEYGANGERYVHLGTIANLTVGAIVAGYMGMAPIASFVAGIAASFIAEGLLEQIKKNPMKFITKTQGREK